MDENGCATREYLEFVIKYYDKNQIIISSGINIGTAEEILTLLNNGIYTRIDQ
jgi:hypothetical protein